MPHQGLHALSLKFNLLGILSEKVRQKLLELLGTLKEKFKNTDKNVLVDFSIKSISSQASNEEGSTTISKESTSQANGDGSGEHLNSDVKEEKDDDIV